jgi:hypothetical protein
MNKRIREVVRKLAEQAYVEHRQEYFCDNDDPTITSVSVTRHFDREKFAELIVRECAGIYSKIDNGNLHMGTDDYLEALQKHFGVEE